MPLGEAYFHLGGQRKRSAVRLTLEKQSAMHTTSNYGDNTVVSLLAAVILVSGFVILLIVFEIQLPYLVWVFVHYIQVSSFLPNSFNDKLFNVVGGGVQHREKYYFSSLCLQIPSS